jgi:hypothetical protein
MRINDNKLVYRMDEGEKRDHTYLLFYPHGPKDHYRKWNPLSFSMLMSCLNTREARKNGRGMINIIHTVEVVVHTIFESFVRRRRVVNICLYVFMTRTLMKT